MKIRRKLYSDNPDKLSFRDRARLSGLGTYSKSGRRKQKEALQSKDTAIKYTLINGLPVVAVEAIGGAQLSSLLGKNPIKGAAIGSAITVPIVGYKAYKDGKDSNRKRNSDLIDVYEGNMSKEEFIKKHYKKK